MIIAAQIIGGLLLLFLGGEAVVRGGVSLAQKLGISTLVIGLTIIAYGTSMPELFLSAEAALDDHPDIALGNVIGSNISNILLVMGASAVIYPISCNYELLKREAPLLVILNLVLIAFCFSGVLSAIHGVILLGISILYTIYIFRTAKSVGSQIAKHQVEEVEEQLSAKPSFLIGLIYIPAGVAMLIFGAKYLVEGASSLAVIFGLSEAFIGVTIAALGSSAPELVTAVVAAYHKHTDVALGNIIGSCMFNIMGILGIVPIIEAIKVNQQFLNYDFWVMLAVTLLLFFFLKSKSQISRIEGIILLILYVSYICSQFYV